jgi:DNA-binding GntR family transcriptional regulator
MSDNNTDQIHCQTKFLCYSLNVAKSFEAPSRVDATVTRLREGIFEGKFPPGTPLRELSIARELSVSQATIREALRHLEHSGLIVRKPNVGSTVTRLSSKDIAERIALRVTLETMAAQLAAPRMGEAEFAELYRRLRILDAAVKSNSYYDAAQADLDFHRYIWKCSGNETLARVLEFVTVPLLAFMSIVRSQGFQRLDSVVQAHEPLILALRNGGAEEIRKNFELAATSGYQPFLGGGPESAAAKAFGFLEVGARTSDGQDR